MSRLAAVLLAGLPIGVALAPSFACAPVRGSPFSIAPVNTCGAQQSCDGYLTSTGAIARTQCLAQSVNNPSTRKDELTGKSRCDYGPPTSDYTIVVNVPDLSFYAPGRVLALTNNDVVPPQGAVVVGASNCKPPGCVPLPQLVSAQGHYLVTAAAATALGLPVPDNTSVPVRVSLLPLAPSTSVEAQTVGIPLDGIQIGSTAIRRTNKGPVEIAYVDTVSVGSYQRIAYPEPPFDAFFPPVFSTLAVSEAFTDDFRVDIAQDPPVPVNPTATPTPLTLDDTLGTTRTSTITRDDGLDGWQVWLADHTTARRISTLKTLKGTTDTVILQTVGFARAPNPGLRDGVDVIISPPPGYLGVPRLVSPIVNGGPFGLRTLAFPSLPSPSTFTGLVAQTGLALTGVPSQVTLTSNGLQHAGVAGIPDTLLKYSTVVTTDDLGRFTTVLPPGVYDVLIEPIESTGRAKTKAIIDTTVSLVGTFLPPARTLLSGRAMLSDGRPLPEATVRALPSGIPPTGSAVTPRPAQITTDADGTFRVEVDQGDYTIVVDPRPDTDFPRIVQARSVSGVTADLGDLVVPPPSILALQLKDPSAVGNPIVRAVVRVFSVLPGRTGPNLEMGVGITDANGNVEIMLAPQAR